MLIAADGSERPIEDSAAPIIDADEKIIGVVLARLQQVVWNLLSNAVKFSAAGSDGYGLIQRIRRSDHAEAAALPAIALTAFARSEDRTRALRAGFQAHLAKPVDPAELLAVVASFAQLIDRSAS